MGLTDWGDSSAWRRFSTSFLEPVVCVDGVSASFELAYCARRFGEHNPKRAAARMGMVPRRGSMRIPLRTEWKSTNRV